MDVRPPGPRKTGCKTPVVKRLVERLLVVRCLVVGPPVVRPLVLRPLGSLSTAGQTLVHKNEPRIEE